MVKFLQLCALAVVCGALSGCADESVKPLDSPCAGIDGSPCGPKRNVNAKPREMVQLPSAAA